MSGKQWAILLLLATIWGSSFLFIKWGLAEMSFLAVVAGRLTFGLVFLIGALVVTGSGVPPRHLWKHLVFVGLANNVIPWTALAWGEQFIPSGIAAMLNATTPLFTLLLAVTWGDEKLTWLKVMGLVLGFAGVGVVIGEDIGTLLSQQGNTMTVLGELALLVMAIGYAIGTVYGRRYLKGVPAAQSATGQLFVAFLVIAPITIFTGNLPTTLPSLQAIGGIVALGLFGSGMAYFLYYHLLTQVGATRTVIVTYLLPIVAILLGYWVLNETITRDMVMGMALILGGVILVNSNLSLTRKMPQTEAAKP
jgi:drug/metabolite transporter (DMT)-like permease